MEGSSKLSGASMYQGLNDLSVTDMGDFLHEKVSLSHILTDT